MMKETIWIAAVVLILVASGCEQSPSATGTSTQPADHTTLNDVAQKTGEAAGAAVDYAIEKKEQLRRWVQQELPKVDRQIDELTDAVQRKADAARPVVEKRLEQLREGVAAARQRVEELKEQAGPALEKAREQLHEAVDDLQRALGHEPETQPTTQPAVP